MVNGPNYADTARLEYPGRPSVNKVKSATPPLLFFPLKGGTLEGGGRVQIATLISKYYDIIKYLPFAVKPSTLDYMSSEKGKKANSKYCEKSEFEN